jgi:hypothetical protein
VTAEGDQGVDHREADIAQQRDVRDQPHAQASDDAGIEQRRDGDAAGDPREDQGKPPPRPQHVDEHLLGRVEEAEQPAQHQGGGQGVADRDPIGQALLERRQHRRDLQGHAVFGMQGLGQLDPRPGDHHQAEDRQDAEHPRPGRDQQDGLAHRRRDDRHAQEDDERQRHHPRHLPAAVAVADDRHRQHPRGRRPDPAQGAGDQQHLERGGEGAEGGEDDIQRQAHQQHRLAAVAIGQRAIGDLGRAEAQQIGGQDPLPLVVGRPRPGPGRSAAWPAASSRWPGRWWPSSPRSGRRTGQSPCRDGGRDQGRRRRRWDWTT